MYKQFAPSASAWPCPASCTTTASDRQAQHGAKWPRQDLMKRLGMGRSEDAPIVSEWGATKRWHCSTTLVRL